MKRSIIGLGALLLTGALVVSALAGPRWQRGWGSGPMMGYGGGPGYCWNQSPTGQASQEAYQNRQGKPMGPQSQTPYVPGPEWRHMGPGRGMNMVPPYGGAIGWGN